MKFSKILLTYTILFNIVNAFLILYATKNPGGEVGMQMYFGFPLFYLIGLVGLMTIAIRNRKDFGSVGNWLLAILCTPIPTMAIIFLLIGKNLK